MGEGEWLVGRAHGRQAKTVDFDDCRPKANTTITNLRALALVIFAESGPHRLLKTTTGDAWTRTVWRLFALMVRFWITETRGLGLMQAVT